MARLTDNLATGYRGKETQRAVDPGPSIWEGIAKTVSAVTGVVDAYKATEKRIAGETSEAAAAAQKKSELGAKNAAAEAKLEIASSPPGADEPQTSSEQAVAAAITTAPDTFENSQGFTATSMGSDPVDGMGLGEADPVAAGAANTAVRSISRMSTAVEQGRANETAYQLRLTQTISRLFTQFPNSKAVIWEEFDKEKISHPLLAPYGRAMSAVNAATDAEVKSEIEDARYFEENYNPDVEDPNIPFAKKVEKGRVMRAKENTLASIDRRAAESRAQGTYDSTRQKDTRRDITLSYVTALETDLVPKLSESTQQFTRLALSPDLEKNIGVLGEGITAYRSAAYAVIEDAFSDIKNRSKGNIDPELLETSRQQMRQRVDDVLLPFDPKNPGNVIQKNATQVKMITDKTGLDITTAAPLLMELKKRFPNSDSLNMLLETTLADPKITRMLAYEMTNFKGLGDPQSKVRLMNTINMIKDRNTDLRDLSVEEGAGVLKNVQGYLVKALPEAARTKDMGLSVDAITALGKVANVAVDLKVGSNYSHSSNALSLMGNASSAAVLINAASDPTNGDYANTVADGVRAAVTQGLITVSRTKLNDPSYDVEFNRASGNYEAKWNGNKRTIVTGNGGTGFMRAEGSTSRKTVVDPPSSATQTKVKVLNHALNFMLRTGQFEDEMPIVKWTNPEQRLFYATGNTPPSQKAKPGEKVESTAIMISKVANYWKNYKVNFSSVPVTVQEASEERGVYTPVPREGLKGTIVKGESGPRGYDGIYGDHKGGNKYNFNPGKPVTQMTMGEAVDFGRKVMIPTTRGKVGAGERKGTSAIGAYQFTQETLTEFGEKLFGSDWRNVTLTPANQDKLAEAIIEDTGLRPSRLIDRWPSLQGKL